MPKRHGNLFDDCFSIECLYDAYERARRRKRKTFSVMRFERNLGANLYDLYNEIHSGEYEIRPYRRFVVREPKIRHISAPAFRDVVVQHAIYKVIYPIFDRCFIHDNYGCRIGKGTHKASDRAQQYMREVHPNSYALQLDIRKFYYSIDRSILRKIIERKIKDKRLVDLMMQFADDGENPIGVPPGNLLSQLYPLIYLNELDHFVKRQLKVKRYVRYVDDMIIWCDNRKQAVEIRDQIITFLKEKLSLSLSRWTIAPVKRGVNFVGFRTWRKRRFVRKHSLFRFSRSLKSGDIQSLNSILGNALHTSSYSHMCRRVINERPDIIHQLASLRRNYADV